MTVNTGQVGVHMLFNWSSSTDIGIVDVWNIDGTYAGPFYSGATTTNNWRSGTNDHTWTLASTGTADYFPGMVNGPFPGFAASFNLAAVPLPGAGWLFPSGLIALAGLTRRKRPTTDGCG